MKEKLVFFGSGPYVPAVIEILSNSFELDLVVTTEKSSDSEIIKICKQKEIQIISVSKTPEILENKSLLSEYKVAVLASFGLIIPDELLNLFPFGIVNIHPSLLPEFRGPTPVQSAILSGKTKVGVTIIKLDDEVDHGPILGSKDYEVQENETGEQVYNKLFRIGGELLVELLPKYLSGDVKPQEQNHTEATFTETLTRESGFIDFNNPPAKDTIKRMIRAYYPWPGVWFKSNLSGNEKIIKLLPQQMIQVEGKKPMSLKDFMNGYSEGKQIIDKLEINE